MIQLFSFLNKMAHWLGLVIVIVVFAFFADRLMHTQHDLTLHGNNVSAVVGSQPDTAMAAALGRAADALKEKALSDALSGRISDLSAAQGTVAGTIASATGLNSRLSSALAEGLTRPAPKVQVITVATKQEPKATVSTAPIALTDDIIKRDLKEVLTDKDTVINTRTDTTVHISYEDKPFSPIFAVYTGKDSGAGYTLRQGRFVDLDLLALKGSTGGFAPGIGVEHKFKGTSAGIGIGETFDLHTHHAATQIYAAVHF